jgi:lysozyme
MPHINEAGLALIEEFEGDELRAYPDPGTGGEPWTIGYGHTASVHPGETITQAQAVEFLRQDVTNAEKEVAMAVEVILTPNQFSGLRFDSKVWNVQVAINTRPPSPRRPRIRE